MRQRAMRIEIARICSQQYAMGLLPRVLPIATNAFRSWEECSQGAHDVISESVQSARSSRAVLSVQTMFASNFKNISRLIRLLEAMRGSL